MTFTLMLLPYNPSDLEPHISARTVDFHHQKHHKTYVDNLNKINATLQTPYNDLIDAVRGSYNVNQALFNNAGQVWNHDFYWHSMIPGGGDKPSGRVLKQIEKDFGSFDKFRDEFIAAGLSQFGSGWVWLVWSSSENKMKIVKTANADNPLTMDLLPLLTSDVWEHAYYLDYQNLRLKYLETFLNHLANWQMVEKQLPIS